MTVESITRRSALKYASLITLAACGGRWIPGHAVPLPQGYGTDPDLLKRNVTWSRTLNASQLRMLAALCDIVLPAEPPHPSASAIGVHEFLDEWVSAPYPPMQADRALILSGLTALGATFENADPQKQTALFDQACRDSATVPFARRLIELICDGYYTTRKGHAAIGYVGNVALAAFPGPPPEVVRHIEQVLDK